jgi:hypothetical protein
VPMPWADKSPDIAGLPGWTDEQAITFFMTGKLNGAAPRPPMPAFRFNKEDARAVTAYLRSLAATPSPSKKAHATGTGGNDSDPREARRLVLSVSIQRRHPGRSRCSGGAKGLTEIAARSLAPPVPGLARGDVFTQLISTGSEHALVWFGSGTVLR